MNELHKFTVTYMKNGKLVTETFDNIVHYSFINAGLFWMREKGALTDNKDNGKWTEKQHWISTDDIIEITSEGGRIISGKKEMLEFKRDMMIG